MLSFGDRWRELLAQEYPDTLELHQYAVSGSHLLHWVDGGLNELTIRNLKYVTGSPVEKTSEPLDCNILGLLRSIQPNETVIALGTNDILYLGDQVKGITYQKALAQLSAASSNLIWILPPCFKNEIASTQLQMEFQQLIKKHFTKTLSSESFSPDQSDGVHFFQSLATRWADHVWNEYLDLQIS